MNRCFSQALPAVLSVAATALLAPLACADAQKPGQPMSPSEARVAFAAADLDQDGYVSLEEFHQDVLRVWRALDLDKDGYTSVKEMLAVVGNDKEVAARLRMADKNDDGKLSFKEVVEARMAFFAAADADNDGQLSLSEVLDYLRKLRPVTKPLR